MQTYSQNKQSGHKQQNNIPLGKAEGKTIIKIQMQKIWQEYWDINETGRHYYNIQKQVGKGGVVGGSRKEKAVTTRLD